MASTPAEICNLALGSIGVSAFIDDLTSETVESEVAAVYYDSTRDEVLEEKPWKFAMRRKLLAPLANATRTNWDFVYKLPADCLAPRFLVPDVQVPGKVDRIPWELEDDETTGGTVLLTDREDAELAYTARITTVGRFSPLFQKALAWKLAGYFALVIPEKAVLAQGCDKMYDKYLLRAFASQLRQGQAGKAPEADSIRVRGAGVRRRW